MDNILAGTILIGVGLALGGAIFRGDFSAMSLFFDGVGLFWIGKGLSRLYKERA